MENVQFDRKGASHSLAVATVVLIFSEELGGEKSGRLADLHEAMAPDFPKASKKTSLNVNLEDGSNTAKQVFTGWKLEAPNLDSNDLIDWQLEAESNRLILRCFNYSGWTEFSQRAIENLTKACKSLKCENNELQEIGVQFIDRFIWDISSEGYSLKKFFNPDSSYFSQEQVKHETPLWHMFQGWKEKVDGLDYIENANISTNQSGNSPHVTEIVHVVRCVGSDSKGDEIFSPENLRTVADRAHILNLEMLRNLLNRETLTFIGLDES